MVAVPQAEWRAIYDSADPVACTWPEPWNSKLDSFQRLLLVRLIRPDKLVSRSLSFSAHLDIRARVCRAATLRPLSNASTSFSFPRSPSRQRRQVGAVQKYVMEAMGRKFIEPPPFDLDKCYQDSSSLTPLIFVLSPGELPTCLLCPAIAS